MPRGFDFPRRDIALWMPLWFDASELEDRSNVFLQGIGRLQPGVTIGSARAELNVRLPPGWPAHFPEANDRTGATVIELRDEVSRQARLMLLALAGASLCVLLIACANLASLLLARAVSASASWRCAWRWARGRGASPARWSPRACCCRPAAA